MQSAPTGAEEYKKEGKIMSVPSSKRGESQLEVISMAHTLAEALQKNYTLDNNR